MSQTEKYDFNVLLERARELIETGNAKNIKELSTALKVDRTTLMSGFFRNFQINSFKEIGTKKTDGKPLIGDDMSKGFQVEIDGNFADIRSVEVLGQIKTVKQLMALANMSEKDWEVVNPELKKWDVALKIKTSKDTEIVQVVPSIYIKAPLRSRHPTAFEPVISPITINLPRLPKIQKKKSGVMRALIVNDPQVGFRRTLHNTDLHPFHDRRVLDLALQIAQEEQIDHISFGGDCLDLSEWSSKFMPEPEFFWTTQPALLEWAWWLTQFRLAAPRAEIKEIEGNHDIRMANLIVTNMRQAYKVKAVDEMELPPALSVPRLLALHKLNIEYISGYPDNGYWLNDNVYITHGDVVRGNPGDTAKAISNKQAFTTIFGHVHRRESVTRRLKMHEGDLIYTAFCPGCACHIDGRVPGSSSSQQWQQGLAIIEYTKDGENIIPLAITDGRMIHNGKLWTARDRDPEVQVFLEGSLKSFA